MSRWAEAATAIRLPADEAKGWRVSGERFDSELATLAGIEAATPGDGDDLLERADDVLYRALERLQRAYTTLGNAPGFAPYYRATMIELRGYAARLGLAPVAVPWERSR